MRTSGADINMTNDPGENAVSVAISCGHHEMVDMPPLRRAHLNTKSLVSFAAEGRLDDVEKLLRQGCDVNMHDSTGDSPLMAAARNGHLSVVKVLRSSGAELNFTNKEGSTPLIAATENGNMDTVEYLVKNGSIVNASRADGWTAVFVATEKSRGDIVELLCRYSADVNVVCDFGYTPLFVAVLNNDLPMIELLMQQGCDTRTVDSMGLTALMRASFRGLLGVVQVFCVRQVNVNVQNPKNGRTALHYAVIKNNLEVVRCLVEAQACVNVIDRTNKTPLNYAISQEVYKVLLQHGAYVSQDSWGSSRRQSISSCLSLSSGWSKTTTASSVKSFETFVKDENNLMETVYSNVLTTVTEGPASVLLKDPEVYMLKGDHDVSADEEPPLTIDDLPRQTKSLEDVVVDSHGLSGYLQRCAEHYVDTHVAGVSRSTATDRVEVYRKNDGMTNYITQNISINIEHATYVQTAESSRIIIKDNHNDVAVTGWGTHMCRRLPADSASDGLQGYNDDLVDTFSLYSSG
ncbi:ankyrin repeat domain-containing protein 29 [Biomphalaria glabrata]|uniref:Ankyrin repeat protein RF_0381 n=1 Tax=Biomphalaria glabrata TaxID=6526 RepID=A0A9W2Z3G0_BIOGL|nr:putative ankyrin repeat protein RF_0381 [Biomphalaria glabrata]KAI8738950.1 ankyrin repeat domain-containing protein 29-like [Biomphalaria glabrata]